MHTNAHPPCKHAPACTQLHPNTYTRNIPSHHVVSHDMTRQNTYILSFIHTYKRTYTYLHTYVHSYVHARTYVHTYTRTHTHITDVVCGSVVCACVHIIFVPVSVVSPSVQSGEQPFPPPGSRQVIVSLAVPRLRVHPQGFAFLSPCFDNMYVRFPRLRVSTNGVQRFSSGGASP